MKVNFEQVGSSNMSWVAEMKELDHDSLYSAVKSKGALMSSNIEFIYDKEVNEGLVIVGDVRVVGKFSVVETVH